MKMDSPKREAGLQAEDTVIILLLSIVCIITIGANIIVIGTIGFTRKLYSVSSALVANMAVFDTSVGFIAMPMVLTGLVNGRWQFSKVTCHVTAVLTSVLCVGSVWSLTAIALDRYFAITYCLRYSTWSPWKYGGILIGSIWILALLFGLSPLMWWESFEVQDVSFTCVVTWKNNIIYGIFVTLLCYFVPLLVMGYCYLRIILVARQHARRIDTITAHSDVNRTNVSTTGAVAAGAMFSVRRLSMLSFSGNVDVKSDVGSFCDNDYNSETLSTSSASPLRRDVRATLRLLGLVGAYVICWLPYLVFCFNNALRGHVSHEHPHIVTYTYCLALTNSAVNPVIYALLSKHFRRATKKLFKSRKSSVVQIGNKNDDCVSTYTTFLRNLRTPASGALSPTSGRNGSPETTSSLTESRSSSVQSFSSYKQRFLDVPTHSFEDAFGFLLPNAVIEDDKKSRWREGGHLQALPQSLSCPSIHTIEDYVYDSKNKANIKIKVDFVPD